MVEFQSLTGRLKTAGTGTRAPRAAQFQSLTGRLKTPALLESERMICRFQSLTGRLKTAGSAPITWATPKRVSIPHR